MNSASLNEPCRKLAPESWDQWVEPIRQALIPNAEPGPNR
jgi:hypothetical protein